MDLLLFLPDTRGDSEISDWVSNLESCSGSGSDLIDGVSRVSRVMLDALLWDLVLLRSMGSSWGSGLGLNLGRSCSKLKIFFFLSDGLSKAGVRGFGEDVEEYRSLLC